MALVGAVAPLAPWAAAPASATTNSAPQVASGTYALGAVFCQSVHSCIAVGAADTDPDPNVIDQVGALVHIVDGVPGPATLVPGTDLLIGVACATSTSCVATGSFQATGASPTIGVAVPVNPDGTPAGSPVEFPGTILLWRVACATASTCVAVGMTPDVDPDPVGSDIKGVVVTITDGDVATADVQYVPDASGLFGVDCGDATSCVAAGIVGVYGSSSTQGVIVPLTISAGTVTAHPAVLATGGPGGGTQFFGVGCSSGTDCTSVGIAVDNPAPSPSAVGLVASTDGATVGVPGTYFLFEADCAAPGSCLAVGSNALSTTSVAGVAVPVTGGTPGPVHSIWGTTFLEGVDCPTTTTCIAVGANGLDVNDSVGVVVTINPEAAATALGVDVTGTQASGSSTATFTATPSSSPAGVTVNGTVTCATVDGGQAIDATLAVGNHTIDAASCTGLSLGGPNTGNYDLVVTGSTFTVTQTQVATTTAVTSSPNPSLFGQAVTLSATVTPNPGAGGTVTFTDGPTTLGTGTLDGAGTASLNTSNLSVGLHSITATYSGSPAFAASSGNVTQTVNKANSTTAVTSAPNPSQFAQNVVLTATVTASAGAGTPTGTVTFKDGATTLGTSAVNGSGQASLGVSTMSVASHTITATYSGNPTINASTSANLTQTVNKALTNVAAANGTGFLRRTYSATLSRAHDGARLSGRPIVFSIAGTTICTATTNANGVASCTVTGVVIGGTYTASYAGDGNHLPSSGSANA